MEETNLTHRAAELRQTFDLSFAQAPEGVSASTEAFLAIAIANGNSSDLYALRLAEIAGLFADKKIVPLPSESTDLLGLTSFRGALIPVYDLRTLLGYSASAARPRWLVLVVAKTPLAIAFEHFDGYLSVTEDFIAKESAQAQRRPHLTGALRTEDRLRPIVSLASVIELLNRQQHH